MNHTYQDIVSVDNLLEAWREFLKGKRGKKDVQEFSLRLMDNILALHDDLAHHCYRHGGYRAFKIADPKPRDIHKAGVRDRLVHHAMYRVLYPFFDRTFVADSFSCRKEKGTHKAINRFRAFAYKVSQNNTRTCWVLKGDVTKFFASIDYAVLKEILERRVEDADVVWLLRQVIDSFRPGLPLGNLTSQLLVNVYMNEFDQFVKHRLKARCYLRYADDFVLLSDDREWLERQIEPMRQFLETRLRLRLHPNKITIKTWASGVDFLGYVHFPDHRVLRTRTKRRMLRRVNDRNLASYAGLLHHCSGYRLSNILFSSSRATLRSE